MQRTQLVAALLVCAVIGLPRGGSAQIVQDTSAPWTTAIGYLALESNTPAGLYNTATGYQALLNNSCNASGACGAGNTAIGAEALQDNTTGYYNTAVGALALSELGGSLIQGVYNTALGANAGSLAGFGATVAGNYNLFLGGGVLGTANDTNTIRIGSAYNGGTTPPSGQNQTFIAGIYGTTVTGGLPVLIDANGQLGVAPASASVATTVAQLQQQVQDLSAQLARLQALIAPSTAIATTP
jgi:hypothetical protein